ncbi:MAG: hypothetical protein A2138_27965 [Deltaproteobacteria bacterium RBG_16_71_12]|nr:MAG: hypothetical protein A2138_27965 [Deltaproteobacteria bacterium RBG_16_71_12]
MQEPGTTMVRNLNRRGRLAASALSFVEVPAALHRRARHGDISMVAARSCAARARADLDRVDLVEPRGTVLAIAAELVERHPLRACDAIQLASALRLRDATGLASTFVCADTTLIAAAKGEGLRVLRPR